MRVSIAAAVPLAVAASPCAATMRTVPSTCAAVGRRAGSVCMHSPSSAIKRGLMPTRLGVPLLSMPCGSRPVIACGTSSKV